MSLLGYMDRIATNLLEKIRSFLYKTLKWNPQRKSRWISKQLFYRKVGYEYCIYAKSDPAFNVWATFWYHVNLFVTHTSLPIFRQMDFDFQVKYGIKKSDSRCNICKQYSNNKNCEHCRIAICFLPFKESPYNLRICSPIKIFPKVSILLEKDIKKYKGRKFAKFLLPNLIRYTNAPYSLSIIERALDTIYQERYPIPSSKTQQQLWIAPLSQLDGNRQSGLVKKILLDSKNTIGILKAEVSHVWGFNASDCSKWHRLQIGDLVLFGNTFYGFGVFGQVRKKFIWSSLEDSQRVFPDGDSWLFGFTIDLQNTSTNLSCQDLQQILKVKNHYQTQCLLSQEQFESLYFWLAN